MSGCYPLGFFKESSRETPLFVPKNDKTAKSCAFLRRNGLQRVSPNKKQNDDVVKYKVVNKRNYKGNEENVSGN